MGEQELNALTCLNLTNMLKKDESWKIHVKLFKWNVNSLKATQYIAF